MKRKEGIRLRMWNTPVIPRPVAVLHTKGLGMMGSLAILLWTVTNKTDTGYKRAHGPASGGCGEA